MTDTDVERHPALEQMDCKPHQLQVTVSLLQQNESPQTEQQLGK